MDNKNKEIRQIIIDSMETRASENGAKVIEGYITKFNTKSQFIGFFEQVSPNAFDKTLADGHNIFAMYNHNDDKILGCTNTGSLVLAIDNIGLRFSLSINSNITYANDTYELVKSGDVDGCSFGFVCNDSDWSTQSDGTDLRTLLDVELIEVTITPFPAYLDSNVSTRSYKEYKDGINKMKENEIRKRRLLIELDL